MMQGTINITSTYDSTSNDIESSLVARGDIWRAEASHGGSTSRNESSTLFLIQLGPVLFVQNTTLLLPVHLSRQHLLWYGYDYKVKKKILFGICPSSLLFFLSYLFHVHLFMSIFLSSCLMLIRFY